MWGRAIGTEGRLALLQVCLGGAGFVAETLAEVLVIGTLGPAWLPVGLAGAALLSLGLTTGLARRPAGPRRLAGLAGAAVVIGLAVSLGLLLVPTVAALLFLLGGRPMRDALAVAFGNVVAPRYDPQTAKRALPRLAAAGQAGAIVIGLLLPLVLHFGGQRAAVVAWPILAGVALLIAWRLPLVVTGGGMTAARPLPTGAGPAVSLRRSPLLLTLAAAAMLAVASGAALGLTAAMILSARVTDRAALASIYALTGSLAGLVVLTVQLVGLPWLLRRMGTARSAVLPPVLTLGVAAWVVGGGGLAAGLAAQFARLAVRPALQTPLEDILLNLLPSSERAAGRAWLRGGAVPLAGLGSSLGLAALAGLGVGPRAMAGLALLLATGGLVAAIALRRQHRRAALALVHSEDALTQRLALPTFGGVDGAVKEEIARRLATSERDGERELLVALLADLDPKAATAAVVAHLPAAPPALAAAWLATLAERNCPAAALLPLAPGLLASPVAEVRRATLAVLLFTPGLGSALVAPLLDDSEPEVALAAVKLLARRGGGDADLARQRLLSLARTGPALVRAAAAPLAALIAPDALVPLLADPSAEVRRAAALAAETLTAPSAAIGDALAAAAADGTSSVRAAVMAALARHRAATPILLAALDDPTPGVRAASATALQQDVAGHLGDLAQALPSEHGWPRATGLAILARAAPWRWRSALLAEEQIALVALARVAVARATLGPPYGPTGALLRRDVDDTITNGLLRWEECLSITDGPGVARVIRQGLTAEGSRARAQAQEALESARSPALARLAAGLLAKGGTVETPPLTEAAARATIADGVGSGGDWRRMLLAAAAREEPGWSHRDGDTAMLDREDGAMLTLVERATLLRGVPPFADLPSEHLRLLAQVAEELDIAAGETLVAAGTEGDHLYVIVAGQVALEERRGATGSVARIGTLGPGAALGEDAVFDGGVHVLSATAVIDCRLLTLERDVLLALLEEQPALARTLIAWLSARLRETSGKLAERTRTRPRSVVDLLDQISDGRR